MMGTNGLHSDLVTVAIRSSPTSESWPLTFFNCLEHYLLPSLGAHASSRCRWTQLFSGPLAASKRLVLWGQRAASERGCPRKNQDSKYSYIRIFIIKYPSRTYVSNKTISMNHAGSWRYIRSVLSVGIETVCLIEYHCEGWTLFNFSNREAKSNVDPPPTNCHTGLHRLALHILLCSW
jgi:hypothetical protein